MTTYHENGFLKDTDTGALVVTGSTGGNGNGLPSNFVTETADYTASAGDVVQADATAGAITVTLPDDPATGSLVTVVKTDDSANAVAVMPAGSGTIDGDSGGGSLDIQNAGSVYEHTGSNAWLTVSAFPSIGGSLPDPSAEADGEVLTTSSGAAVWAAPTGGGAGDPWRIDINVFLPSVVGTWSLLSGAFIGGGITKGTSGAQNDSIAWDIVLAAGTWNLTLIYQQRADGGIYTVTVDGTTVGTIDGYAAATTSNATSTISGITVASGGKKRVSLTMATKNASSSGFIYAIQALGLRRTA